MEFVIAVILIGLLPAFIAQGKGRSFGVWWFYGSMLFIVALPHALLLKPDVQAMENEQLGQGMKKCPYCAELIKEQAIVCRFCGRELGAAAPLQPSQVDTGQLAEIPAKTTHRGLAILVAVVLGSIAVIGIMVAIGPASVQFMDRPASVFGQDGVTLAQFNSLGDGMSYDEVVQVLGRAGVEQSRSSLGDLVTVMYTWPGAGMPGANMNAMFQRGRLVSKAQFGLR
jgi:hypothetical protein